LATRTIAAWLYI